MRGDEAYGVVVLLAPLYKAALEVGLLLEQRAGAQVVAEYAVDEQAVDEIVSLIEVYSPHHRLECVAVDMFLREARRRVCYDVGVEFEAFGHLVERLPRYHLRAQLREETLVLVGELDEQIVRRDALDDGVTQKLQSFVVYLAAVVERDRGRLVYECELVELDVVRNESEHVVDGGVELAVLAETAAYGS